MATATATRRAPAPNRGPIGDRRPRLEVVGPPTRRRVRASRRPILVLAAVLVVGSLLFAAAVEAYMTQQQVRLSQVQARLAVQLAEHRNLELQVAQLSNPSHVVSAAQSQGLTVPSQVTDLPQVTVPPAVSHGARRSSTRARAAAPAHHGTAAGASGAGGK
ncbi:MAG TPA: hypothetical protein VN799_02485 [Acidimicrobiales bacterium]|nr:hypothetical protein [Acidimicrobiales bacterium]